MPQNKLYMILLVFLVFSKRFLSWRSFFIQGWYGRLTGAMLRWCCYSSLSSIPRATFSTASWNFRNDLGFPSLRVLGKLNGFLVSMTNGLKHLLIIRFLSSGLGQVWLERDLRKAPQQQVFLVLFGSFITSTLFYGLHGYRVLRVLHADQLRLKTSDFCSLYQM